MCCVPNWYCLDEKREKKHKQTNKQKQIKTSPPITQEQSRGLAERGQEEEQENERH